VKGDQKEENAKGPSEEARWQRNRRLGADQGPEEEAEAEEKGRTQVHIPFFVIGQGGK